VLRTKQTRNENETFSRPVYNDCLANTLYLLNIVRQDHFDETTLLTHLRAIPDANYFPDKIPPPVLQQLKALVYTYMYAVDRIVEPIDAEAVKFAFDILNPVLNPANGDPILSNNALTALWVLVGHTLFSLLYEILQANKPNTNHP
jgi:hypothetical protein